MKVTRIQPLERGLKLYWDDDSVSELPYIWLRDNDPDEFHPDTKERVFDLTSVAIDTRPDSCEFQDDMLLLQWPDKAGISSYSLSWLMAHQPGKKRVDPAEVDRVLWDGRDLSPIPRFVAKDCIESPRMMIEMLVEAKRSGLLIIEGLEADALAGERFAELIGFKRETNYGVMFEVVSKVDPNNLAYTSLKLPLHTDLANQQVIPSYQFLHCFKNSTNGGESVFADGFRIWRDYQESDPEAAELLRTTPVPFRFHDDEYDIRKHRPIVGYREDGELAYFAFNAHLVDIPDMSSELLYDFYAAYQQLMLKVREPVYSVHYALQPGEMFFFDNLRVLHGRDAFDPTSGERHLRGYYIENNEVDSRIRVLARDLN